MEHVWFTHLKVSVRLMALGVWVCGQPGLLFALGSRAGFEGILFRKLFAKERAEEE